MTEEVQLAVTTAQFGELLRDMDGAETVAAHDMVILIPIVNGEHQRSLEMTPEQALAVATILTDSAVSLLNAEVDDDGKPLSLLSRLQRIRHSTTLPRTKDTE